MCGWGEKREKGVEWGIIIIIILIFFLVRS